MPSLRELVDAESGKRTYDDDYVCPVLGPVSIRSITEEEYLFEVIRWGIEDDGKTDDIKQRLTNAKMVQMCVVDKATRNLVFADTLDDVQRMTKLRMEVVRPLLKRVEAWNLPKAPAKY